MRIHLDIFHGIKLATVKVCEDTLTDKIFLGDIRYRNIARLQFRLVESTRSKSVAYKQARRFVSRRNHLRPLSFPRDSISTHALCPVLAITRRIYHGCTWVMP